MPMNSNNAKAAGLANAANAERVRPEELPVGTILNGQFKLIECTLNHPTLALNYNAINQAGDPFIVKVDAEVNLLSFVRSEGGFLQAVQKAEKCELFVEIVHGAKYKNYIYFVTRFRPGPSINDCWCSMPSGTLSPGSASRVIYYFFKALEVVHNLGYLLRRVDPNVIKFDAATRQIYLSDLSSTRLDPTRAKMTVHVRWAGAAQYAPLQHHQMKTHLRRHDLEAGLYLLVEMTLGKLPWEGTPPDMMGSAKRSAITSQSLFSKCPPQYATLYTIVSCLGDNDKIDYGQLYSKLEDAWKSTGVGDIAAAYDWEAHMKPLEEQ